MKWYGMANHLPSKTQKFLDSAVGSPYLAVRALRVHSGPRRPRVHIAVDGQPEELLSDTVRDDVTTQDAPVVAAVSRFWMVAAGWRGPPC
jgi:hypothetical protein